MNSLLRELVFASIMVLGVAGTMDHASGTSRRTERFEGWLHYQGEFLLYASKADMRAGMHENCVSGAFAIERQLRAPFGGKHVVVIGYRVPWLNPDGLTMSESWQGSAVENWCRGKFIIFATTVRLK